MVSLARMARERSGYSGDRLERQAGKLSSSSDVWGQRVFKRKEIFGWEGAGESVGWQDGRQIDGWMAHALFAALECFGRAHEVITNVT